MDDQVDLTSANPVEIIDGLAVAVVVVDGVGRIVHANPALEQLLGADRSAVIGRRLTDFVDPVDHHGSEPPGTNRRVIQRPDGREVTVDVALTRHRAAAGGEVTVVTLHDLSDRIALEREQGLARYLSAMRTLSSRLTMIDQLDSLPDAGAIVLDAIGGSLGWDVGAIWARANHRLQLLVRWSAPGFETAAAEIAHDDRVFEAGSGLPGRVLASGEPSWIEELDADDNFPRSPIAARHGLRSGIGFPIISQGLVIGVVEFFARAPKVAHPEVLAALTTAGAEIGRLVERRQEVLRAEEARAHRLELADALQAALLPPHLPAIPGLQLASRYRAASGEGEVGGDFFDVFPLVDGWAVTIGDVCGRGPRAAALAALARHTVRAAAVATPVASDVLLVVNDVIRQELDEDGVDDRFLTLVYCTMRSRPGGWQIQVACAGHPPPLVVRHAGPVEKTECHGGLIGVFETFPTRQHNITLESGDSLVLYTDGVVEARGAGGRLGDDRLQAVLAAASTLDAESIAQRVLDEVTTHTGGQLEDDLAVMVIRGTAGDADAPEPVAVATTIG